MAELWDIYDTRAQKTGRCMERGALFTPGEFHQVVHIWLINSKGELLIQKRAAQVAWRPGIWAATGGSAVAGEDVYTAAIRELSEELGIRGVEDSMEFVMTIKHRNSLCSVWAVFCDIPVERLVLQQEEVEEARWVSRETLFAMMERQEFYRYDYLEFLLRYLERR